MLIEVTCKDKLRQPIQAANQKTHAVIRPPRERAGAEPRGLIPQCGMRRLGHHLPAGYRF